MTEQTHPDPVMPFVHDDTETTAPEGVDPVMPWTEVAEPKAAKASADDKAPPRKRG